MYLKNEAGYFLTFSKYCNSTENFTKGVYVCGNYDGARGCLFVDGSGNKLFFPAAGYGDNNSLTSIGNGYYWSRILYPNNPSDKAYSLIFSPDVYPGIEDDRYHGFPVRPVSDSQ